MRILGCDLHARQQTLAMLDTTTREVIRSETPPKFVPRKPASNMIAAMQN
jgi:hypothetical protein